MTVQAEETEYCKVKVSYKADSKLVEEKKKEAIQMIKKSGVNIPGFRVGKATDLAIRVNMKEQINQYVSRELTSDAYNEALFETKVKPMGMPDVHLATLGDDNTFNCEMTICKKPEFELNEYSDFEIPEPHMELQVSEAAEGLIQELREMHGETVMYEEDDTVQDGDQVTMDIEVTVDDERVDEMSQEGIIYTVGKNLVKEFDCQLYGMKAGETKTFHVTFEDDDKYVPKVRGKRVKFEVTVHVGTKLIPAPLDDSFAKKLNFESFEEMRKEAEGMASDRLQQERTKKVQDQIMKRILENHHFEVPDWMTLQSAQAEAAQKGIKWDDLSDDQIDTMLENHENDVKLSLILDEIRELEPEASFTEQELIEKLREQLASNGQDANQVISSAAQSGHLMGVLAAMKDELTMNWLVDQSTIISEGTKEEENDSENNEEENDQANTETTK